MNAYEKKELRRHILLYSNDCLETLDIVCPHSFRKMIISHMVFKMNGSPWESFEIMMQDNYRKGMYPKIRKPSLWKRFKRWVIKCLK